MFGFGKKKVEAENIKTFQDALRAISVFIYLKEWDNAKNALSEIKQKEETAFAALEEKLKDNYSESEKQRKLYEKNKEKIAKLEGKYEVEKIKYERIQETEKFNIRFKRVKQELSKLTATGKNNEALNLLTHFLEDNQNNTDVIKFYDKEKKRILKSIEVKKEKDKKKVKYNAEIEALKLIGTTVKIEEEKKDEEEEKGKKETSKFQIPFIVNIKEKLNFYQNIKQRLKKKKLLDEIKMLIDEENKAKEEIASQKLENIHKGLVKELTKDTMIGYDVYGKILGHDKISGDTFGIAESKERYNLYIGDATGHGVRAGLIVSMLNKDFQEHSQKDNIQSIVFKTNNNLKENLQSRNFITGIFFEIYKELKSTINFVGMWHEPIFVYRKSENKVEKIIPGWLAGGIRLFKNVEEVKVQQIEMKDGDVVLSYSDGAVEAKNNEGKYYGIEKLGQTFLEAAQTYENIYEIYDFIIEDLKLFKAGTSFFDDTTLLILRRNEKKDILTSESVEIQNIKAKEGLSNKDVKRLENKTKEEIEAELLKIRKERETENIIKILEGLYITGEIIKLKQEATRFIKEWFIHKKINYYLKKAIARENDYKISQKNAKMENKFNVLLELYKKNDFRTVITEINEIIAKDGNI